MKTVSVWEMIKKISIITFGALLGALALNFFLIPANVYASGFAGASQLLSRILADFASIQVSTGILLLLFNIPVAILGWLKVGRSFTLYSFLSVVLTTVFLEFIPVQERAEDVMLYAVFGGVIAAIGIGITLKVGASTGGSISFPWCCRG